MAPNYTGSLSFIDQRASFVTNELSALGYGACTIPTAIHSTGENHSSSIEPNPFQISFT